MKLGFVIQRYGERISGGAELHCRLIAEHLAEKHSVEVFTTCAHDYVTWKNAYPRGTEKINGVIVHRFKVKKVRNLHRFFDIQNLVFSGDQPLELQEKWILENGPFCPQLIRAISKRRDIQTWFLFSYRYWTTVHALRKLTSRACLIPTAEHDPALHLTVFKEIFNLPKAIIYNCKEEYDLIREVAQNDSVPGDIVGVGLVEKKEITTDPDKYKSFHPYVIYVGRIDKNKGCNFLFYYFQRFCQDVRSDIHLLLIGTSVLKIPDHPNIHHLGFVSEADKLSAVAGSRALIMPSRYESLSMVVLEAWREHRPVIANKQCEVLEGQCLRSNGGLVFNGYEEFAHALNLLVSHPDLADKLGDQGYQYFIENYSWPVIMKKYEDILNLYPRK